MKTLSIDIETYAGADLAKCGVYRYAESPDFEILLFGCSIDGGPVRVYDLASGEKLPGDILAALTDGSVIKRAFNAQFERVCLSRWLRDNNGDTAERFLDPASWRCSMVWSAAMGLPLSLEGAGNVLGLEKRKLTQGKELIRFFCRPCEPTKANGGRRRNLPADAPDKWEAFKRYNCRDVETEQAIQDRLSLFPLPEEIWEEYRIDQEINDRGVALDMRFVEKAIAMDTFACGELTRAMKALTGVENPNSVAQIKDWLAAHGMEMDSLGREEVALALRDAPPAVREVLLLRQQLSRSSTRKYRAMQAAVCADGRARGMFQFYGANRTGRWAGRIIQLQNLPQNRIQDLGKARENVLAGKTEAVRSLCGDVTDALSQLIRTAFVPRPGCRFIVADYSAIEARILAWLAGETWRQEVFARGGDIYCASASQMFRVPVEKYGVNAHLRQKGKIAELALGYGGSVGALEAMGAVEMGLEERELKPLVELWRSSNPHITNLWRDVDRAAMDTVAMHISTEAAGIRFSYRSGILFITLPSGRKLAYVKPGIGKNRFGGDAITYEGTGPEKKWERLETYGAKLVENIVQGIARDILCHAMKALRSCRIVMHIHDELVIEARPQLTAEAVCGQMSLSPQWAKGLLLRADGYETDYYRKD